MCLLPWFAVLLSCKGNSPDNASDRYMWYICIDSTLYAHPLTYTIYLIWEIIPIGTYQHSSHWSINYILLLSTRKYHRYLPMKQLFAKLDKLYIYKLCIVTAWTNYPVVKSWGDASIISPAATLSTVYWWGRHVTGSLLWLCAYCRALKF